MISLGLVTTTHYKIGGSVVTPRFGGLLHRELEALHGHKGYGRWVLSGASTDRCV